MRENQPNNPEHQPSQPAPLRRHLLRGIVAGAAGAIGLAVSPSSLFAAQRPGKINGRPAGMRGFPGIPGTSDVSDSGPGTTSCLNPTSIQDILTIACTMEQLAVTFYSNGIANAQKLGLKGISLAHVQAALVEEQMHEYSFSDNGGSSLHDTFSFPSGAGTFSNLKTFITTQQLLEDLLSSTLLIAVREFAMLRRPDLAQVAAQIATVEAEHRVLGRVIGNLYPANNWAYTPISVAQVLDVPQVAEKNGFFTPKVGNSFSYHEANTNNAAVGEREISSPNVTYCRH
jgi:hypothetical protein